MAGYSWILGVDLGQAADFTAITASRPVVHDGQVALDTAHIERLKLGLSYTAIEAAVEQHARGAAKHGKTALVIDATGVGRPIVDSLRRRLADVELLTIIAVTITSGHSASRNGRWFNVPKRDLIGAAIVLLESRRLRLGASAHRDLLIRELKAFSYKFKASGHESMEGSGEHDDLVLAEAMACWFALRGPVDVGKLVPRMHDNLTPEKMDAAIEAARKAVQPTTQIPREHIDRAQRQLERERRKAERDIVKRTRGVYETILANIRGGKSE